MRRVRYSLLFISSVFFGAMFGGALLHFLGVSLLPATNVPVFDASPAEAMGREFGQTQGEAVHEDDFAGRILHRDSRQSAEASVSNSASDLLALPPALFLPLEQMQAWPELVSFEESLREQPIDSHWAPHMESRILDSLVESGVEVMQMQIHCRTTICRLEVSINIERMPDLGEHAPLEIMREMNSIAIGGWRVNTIESQTFGNLATPTFQGDPIRTTVAYFYYREWWGRMSQDSRTQE